MVRCGEAFSARAGQEFGFSKGSKSRLFLADVERVR